MQTTPRCATWLFTATLLGAVGDALSAPNCTTPITFAFFEAGLLYSEKTNDGIDKAVVDELARRSKCPFEVSVKPRPRIWMELERGELMMTGSALRTEERDAYAWAVSYFGMKAEMMVRNTNGNAPKSREEFLKDDSLKMGVGRGLKHGEAMDRFIDELQQRNRVVDVLPSSVYEMFVRERFAAMPIYPLDTNYRNKHDLSQHLIATDWFPTDKSLPRALLFSKKYFTKAQVQEWRVLVQQMRDDGTLRRIYTRFTDKDTADKLLQFPPDAP